MTTATPFDINSLYQRYGGQQAFESRLFDINRNRGGVNEAPIFRAGDISAPNAWDETQRREVTDGDSTGRWEETTRPMYKGWGLVGQNKDNELNFQFNPLGGWGNEPKYEPYMPWGYTPDQGYSPEQQIEADRVKAEYDDSMKTWVAENEGKPLDSFTYGVKTGGQHGQTWGYKREGDYYVPVANFGIQGGQNSPWDTNRMSRELNKGLLTVASAGLAGGAFGAYGQAAGQAYSVGNAANNAWQAAEDDNWGGAIASGAGALAGGANMAGATDLANYANLASKGAGFYNAVQNKDPFAAIRAGTGAYNAYGNLQGTSMEDYGDQEPGGGYSYDPSDPWTTEPGYGGNGPYDMPLPDDQEPGGGGNYSYTPPSGPSGWQQFMQNPLVAQIMRQFSGGGGPQGNRPQGTNAGGLAGLLAALQGRNVQRGYGNDMGGVADYLRGNSQPFIDQLAKSYSDPQSFLDSPEMKARLGIEANRLTGIDSSKGRLSNDFGRTVKLQEYGMAGLDKYRSGLADAVSRTYQPGVESQARGAASGARRNENTGLAGFAALAARGNQGNIVKDIESLISGGKSVWDTLSSWWDDDMSGVY